MKICIMVNDLQMTNLFILVLMVFLLLTFSTAGICYNYQSKTQGLASVGKYGLPVVVMENGVDIKCKPSEHVIYSDKTFGSFFI